MHGLALTPEALRDVALARCAHPVARLAIEHGVFTITPSGRAWQASLGLVQGLEVVLGVGPATLGALSRLASAEALRECVSAAVTHFDAVSLRSFALRWQLSQDPPALRGPARTTTPYRDRAHAASDERAHRDDPRAIASALEAYLDARGTALPSHRLAHRIDVDARGAVHLAVAADELRRHPLRDEVAALVTALEDLCAPAPVALGALPVVRE